MHPFFSGRNELKLTQCRDNKLGNKVGNTFQIRIFTANQVDTMLSCSCYFHNINKRS